MIIIVNISSIVKRIALIWMVGAAQKQTVGINNVFVLNVTLTISFEGNLTKKQHIIITLIQ
jgi:hypothetical protein